MKKALLLLLFLPVCLQAQEFNLEQFITKHTGKMADSTICKLALDAMQERDDDWYGSKVIASDDGKVNVFQFIGKNCGAYCNPFYEQAVVYQAKGAGKTHVLMDESVFNFALNKIIYMNESGLYLGLGTTQGRPRAIEGIWGESAALFSLEKKLSKIWEFESVTSSFVEVDDPKSELIYDPETQTIRYEYDYYEEEDLDYFKVKGKWKFNGKTFELVKEERKDL